MGYISNILSPDAGLECFQSISSFLPELEFLCTASVAVQRKSKPQGLNSWQLPRFFLTASCHEEVKEELAESASSKKPKKSPAKLQATSREKFGLLVIARAGRAGRDRMPEVILLFCRSNT